MATLPTAEDGARKALDVFAHYNAQPRHVLQQKLFWQLAVVTWRFDQKALVEGIDLGVERGWFEITANDSVLLTEAGFAEM